MCKATSHYRCLYPTKYISTQWGNKNSPSKLLIAFMQSMAFKYTCPICRTTKNTPIPTTNHNTTITSTNTSNDLTIENKLKTVIDIQ